MPIILLAADAAPRRRRLCQIVETAGYPLAGITDSIVLLRLLRSARQPYVVVLDIQRPALESSTLLALLVHERWLMPAHAYVLCTAQPDWAAVALRPVRDTLTMQILPTHCAAITLTRAVAQAVALLAPPAAALADGPAPRVSGWW